MLVEKRNKEEESWLARNDPIAAKILFIRLVSGERLEKMVVVGMDPTTKA